MPYEQDEIVADILDAAREIRENFDTFVVLGIGGSALGPTAIQFALNHMRWNELPKEKRNGYPRLYVEDNVDPERLAALFDVIDLKTTAFNVISKSGATSETMSQFLIIREKLIEAVGDDWARHIYATTDKERGNLIKIADAEGMRKFVIPDGVGGRFSEICPVGLLRRGVRHRHPCDARRLRIYGRDLPRERHFQEPRDARRRRQIRRDAQGQEHLRHHALCRQP